MNRISKRQDKYDKLKSEIKYFKIDKAIHVISDELPWRMVMRIVNKFERIRNTGGLTDAEKGLKGCRKHKNEQLPVQLDLFSIIDTMTTKQND